MKRKTIWLGFDGAYVLSSQPLVIFSDGDCRYLAPQTGMCTDLDDHQGRLVFGHLKLKKFDVVKVTLPSGARVLKAKEAKK